MMFFYVYNWTDQILIWIWKTVINKEKVSDLLVLM